MESVDAADLVKGRGLAGSADQGGRRQITLLAIELWEEAIAGLGARPDPSARRANVLLRGVELSDCTGRELRLGGCRILIHGETRPCALMDRACPGLRRALASPWRGGAFGEILSSGRIAVGDPARWRG